jgi:hypothetical protein
MNIPASPKSREREEHREPTQSASAILDRLREGRLIDRSDAVAESLGVAWGEFSESAELRAEVRRLAHQHYESARDDHRRMTQMLHQAQRRAQFEQKLFSIIEPLTRS